jgi:hypothetical protein
MKGIEGMALKYVVVLLVAALVIGVVYSVMVGFTGMIVQNSDKLTSVTNSGMEKSMNTTCTTFGCVWNGTDCRC